MKAVFMAQKAAMNCIRRKLILFTRYPVPGKAKTRLIPELGKEKAAKLQEIMTGHTLINARCCGAAFDTSIEIRFCGSGKRNMRRWLGNGPKYIPQGKGDLGQRIERAFRDAFETGFDHVMIIGCDCPQLDVECLSHAIEALKENDMIIGPALDGGYYLIGLRKPAPQLFVEIDWGTEYVFEQTIKIAETEGLKIAQLKQLSDVDQPEDMSICRNLGMLGSSRNTISVIIAALNEQAHIETSIASAYKDALEVIVADGGSKDNTLDLARRAGACTMSVPYGRYAQFNAAALKAKGNVFLFLHADTILPEGFAEEIFKTLKKANVAAGAFRLAIDADKTAIRIVETFTNLRSRLFQLPYGDQAIFMQRDVFLRSGGFASIPVLEDYEFVRRLRRQGRIKTVNKQVRTSARRWLHLGVLPTTIINQLMIAGYWLGISPSRLAVFYRNRKKVT